MKNINLALVLFVFSATLQATCEISTQCVTDRKYVASLERPPPIVGGTQNEFVAKTYFWERLAAWIAPGSQTGSQSNQRPDGYRGYYRHHGYYGYHNYHYGYHSYYDYYDIGYYNERVPPIVAPEYACDDKGGCMQLRVW